jgi:hypothetical protein
MLADKHIRRLEIALPAVLCAVLLAFSAGSLTDIVLDHDEVQHLHIAWRISAGDQPYVDFADNHNHLFPSLLALTLPDGDDPGAAVFRGRLFMMLCTALTLFMLWALAAQLTNRRLALLVPLALAGSAWWSICSGAIRPDVPMTTAITAGWLVYYRSRDSAGPWGPFAAGALWGLSTALLAKAALAAVGPGLVLLFAVVRDSKQRKQRLLQLVALCAGFGVVAGAYLAWLWADGLLGPFFFWVVRFNTEYLAPSASDPGFGVLQVLGASLASDGPLWVLACLGIPLACWRGAGEARQIPLAVYFALLVSSTFQLNQPNYQYLLPLLTLLPVVAVTGLQHGLDWLRSRWPEPGALAGLVVALLLAGTAVPSLMEIADVDDSSSQLDRIKQVLEMVPADHLVIATPPEHPIFRKDALYLWFNNPRFHNVLTRLDPSPPLDRWKMDPQRLISDPPTAIITDGTKIHSFYGLNDLVKERYLTWAKDPEVLFLDVFVQGL